MSLEVTGTITTILEVTTGQSAKGDWKKQEFVIQTQEQYSKLIAFTLFNDKTSLLQGFQVGSSVKVSFNVESREYNGRYFHNVGAWKIEADSGVQTPPPFTPQEITPPKEGESDLPW